MNNLTRREPRPAKQVNATARPRAVAQGSGLLALAMEPTAASVAVHQKTPDRRDQRIRDSARGEECTVRIYR